MSKPTIRFGLCPHLPAEFPAVVKKAWKAAHPGVKVEIKPFLFSTVTPDNEVPASFPDVFIYESVCLPNYAQKGVIGEITHQVPKDENYHQFVMDSVRFQGKTYAIPMFMLTEALFSKKPVSEEYTDIVSFVKQHKGTVSQPALFDPLAISRLYAMLANQGQYINMPTAIKEVDQNAAGLFKELLNNSEIFTKEEFLCCPCEKKAHLLTFTNQILKKDVAELKSELFVTKLADTPNNFSYKSVVLSVNKNSSVDPAICESFLKFLSENEEVHKCVDKYFLPAYLPTLEQIKQQDAFMAKIHNALLAAHKVAGAKHIVPQFTTPLGKNLMMTKAILSQAIQHRSISHIRCLAADMVEKPNSGHPGMPIGMAPTAYIVWKYFMNTNPENMKWINRDRFILSGGHGCALQYVMLVLAGVTGLSMEDLKQFRVLDSKTPGHPENTHTPGIEATTGPLGQGIANTTGMALAAKHLAAKYGSELFNHFFYTFCGDGDLQEGVALEGAALAGRYKLDNIIVFYDDNQITIDGPTTLAFHENVPQLFEAYGWDVQTVENANFDLLGIKKAVLNAQKVKGKPHLIRVKTTIGYSSIKQGTEKVHGSPLGAEGCMKLKEVSGYFSDPKQTFVMPEDIMQEMNSIIKTRGQKHEADWNAAFEQAKKTHSDKAENLQMFLSGELPKNWEEKLPKKRTGANATRKSSGDVLNAVAPALGNLIGGSADLTPSNNTWLESSKDLVPPTYEGNYIRYGVREHGMCAVANGIALYGAGLIPYCATFLVFAGYALGAIRLSAISHAQVMYVFTHDSIGVGEDGPTHQPVETLATLRSIPGLQVMRPADTEEASGAYMAAINSRHTPTVFALSRQNVPELPESSRDGVLKGAYILKKEDASKPLDLIFVASGTEVSLVIKAAAVLKEKEGKNIRVVSFPCWELFEKQSVEYKQSVLYGENNQIVPVVAVEAAIMQGWEKYSHYQIGMTSFGASGPAEKVYEKFGLSCDNIVNKSLKYIEKSKLKKVHELFE